ncbi:hypothetical protein [Streptomyces sedi]|uniref:hypothetical protein n=1 Tax=Streptomyces sedi TaxID=555059 RepID=UPI0014777A75|nr:hypothetical protein [Streptomyces sedi]
MTETAVRAAYHTRLLPRYRYRSVATLADEPDGLTCSVAVGTEYFAGLAERLSGYPSFELAADSVREGREDALLVPGAYAEVRGFFFDPELVAVGAFLSRLPDMVLVASDGGRADSYRRLCHQPATLRLLDQIDKSFDEVLPATSNTTAVRDIVQGRPDTLAVTNRLVAEHHGLDVIQVLARGTPMAFIVFERKPE